MIRLADHPLLAARAIRSVLPGPLEQHPSPPWLCELLALDAKTPLSWSDELRGAVRDMLRHSGYKPTGRGKPASEYLRKTAAESSLASINCAVDVCNVVSLHSGFPISVVDLARAREPVHARRPLGCAEGRRGRERRQRSDDLSAHSSLIRSVGHDPTAPRPRFPLRFCRV